MLLGKLTIPIFITFWVHIFLISIKNGNLIGFTEVNFLQLVVYELLILSRQKLTTVLCQGFRIRDKETESPYLIHPLTYRQVYLTKYAYFGEKTHGVLEKMP